MKSRIFFAALAACMLLVTAACENDGGVFDPTSVLDTAGETASDGMLLVDGFDEAEKSDGDDDDDDHCNSSDSDLPDAYDEEMIPSGDGDDDDDDDC